jgi:hypothetical protein
MFGTAVSLAVERWRSPTRAGPPDDRPTACLNAVTGTTPWREVHGENTART